MRHFFFPFVGLGQGEEIEKKNKFWGREEEEEEEEEEEGAPPPRPPSLPSERRRGKEGLVRGARKRGAGPGRKGRREGNTPSFIILII
jgi:hypothetical protein